MEKLLQDPRYQFWLLQLIGWLGWVGLYVIRDMYWGQPLSRIFLLIIDAIAGFLLTTGLRYVYIAVWEKSANIRVITAIIGSLLISWIWQPIKNYSQFVYYNDFTEVEKFDKLDFGFMQISMAYFSGWQQLSFFIFLGWSALYFGLKFNRMWQKERRRSIRAESMAHQAQLRMLRYQLNPHFLFNTLNAISTLILEKETNAANQMVSKLSGFLRYSLDKDAMQEVDLVHEINTMKLYLDIEQVRFDDRLKVKINVNDDVKDALVPSLLLQPLVENAIKHAIANRFDGGSITINASKFTGDLLIEVSDNGPGLVLSPGEEPVFSGVGLKNTKERLKELYGANYSLKFLPVLPHGLNVSIRIPFTKKS
jgi:two-component system LytT family sensor kinase